MNFRITESNDFKIKTTNQNFSITYFSKKFVQYKVMNFKSDRLSLYQKFYSTVTPVTHRVNTRKNIIDSDFVLIRPDVNSCRHQLKPIPFTCQSTINFIKNEICSVLVKINVSRYFRDFYHISIQTKDLMFKTKRFSKLKLVDPWVFRTLI